MKVIDKAIAIDLRKKGKSINEIVKSTGFSKGSVSVWVRDVVLSNEQKKRISEHGRSMQSVEKRRLSRLKNEHEKRLVVTNEAKKDFTNLSERDLKLIGITLYLGEGAKTRRGIVQFTNSDPIVIKIMMRFFREICLVPEKKFRGSIHTFEGADISKSEKYWSNLSSIPLNQFYKTYTKQSSASLKKRQTLSHGTFDIYVCNTKLFLTIMGWIEKIKEITVAKE